MGYLISLDGFTQECDNGFGKFCVETNTGVFDGACIQDYRFELEFTTGDFLYTDLGGANGIDQWYVIQVDSPGTTILGLDPMPVSEGIASQCLEGIIQEIGMTFTLRIVNKTDPSIVISTETLQFDDVVEIGAPNTNTLLTNLIADGTLLSPTEASRNGQRIVVNGNLIVNTDYDFSFNPFLGNGQRTQLLMRDNASIQVTNGARLRMNLTRVNACENRWNNIHLSNGTSLDIGAGGPVVFTEITGATTGVELDDGAELILRKALFSDNITGIGSFGPSFKNITINNGFGGGVTGASLEIENGTDGMVFENTSPISLSTFSIIDNMSDQGIVLINTDATLRDLIIDDTEVGVNYSGSSTLLDIRNCVISNSNTAGIGVFGNPSVYAAHGNSMFNNRIGTYFSGLLNADVLIESNTAFNEDYNIIGIIAPSRGGIISNEYFAKRTNVLLYGTGVGMNSNEWAVEHNALVSDGTGNFDANIVFQNLSYPRAFDNAALVGTQFNVLAIGGESPVIGLNTVMESIGQGIRVSDSPQSLIYCNKMDAPSGLQLLQDCSGSEVRSNEMTGTGLNLIYGSSANTFAMVGEQEFKGNLFDPSSLTNIKAVDFNSLSEVALNNTYIVADSLQGDPNYPFFTSINPDWFVPLPGGITPNCPASGLQDPEEISVSSLDSSIYAELRAVSAYQSTNPELAALLKLKATRHLDRAAWPTLSDPALNTLATNLASSPFATYVNYENKLARALTYNTLDATNAQASKEQIQALNASIDSILIAAYDTTDYSYQLTPGEEANITALQQTITNEQNALNTYDQTYKQELQTVFPSLQLDATNITNSTEPSLARLGTLHLGLLQFITGDLKGFTTTQRNQIKAIANGCVAQEGEAVYLARSLYLALEPDDALILQSGWDDECISAPAMKPIEVQTSPKALNLRVFPNPAEETITLQLPPELRSDQPLTLEVMDSRGSRVLTQTLPGDVVTHRQVVGQLPSGVYVISLFDQRRELLVQQRFVKQ